VSEAVALRAALPGLRFRSAARTDAGAVRTHNEDAFLDRPEARLWAVADGMGGHQDGAAASRLVTEALSDLGGFSSGYAFLTGVSEAIAGANRALVARAAEFSEGGVTGATVVALLVEEAHAACVWAGDSRAYHLDSAGLHRLTRDHSLLQELVDSGALSVEAAAIDRRGNIVTRAVGAAAELELDRAFAAVAPGDRFLLCSDGLTGMVSDEEIAEALKASDPDASADLLLALALGRGATDNVTLVVIEALG
jgi:serine/threonine protein phosphatase PrpC